MFTRRAALGSLAGFAAFTSGRASAQTFPSRAITIIVPYPAGGPVDAVARIFANDADLGQPVTVDNRGGASGIVGANAVARAEPDGYTLVLGTNQTHATNQSLLKNCPYDAVKDFTPVANVCEIPHALVVRKTLEATDIAGLVALAKSKPGALNYGSTGNGSASHLAAELFKTKAGIEMQHIPFRGAAPMTTELLAGRIDVAFATLPSVIAQIDSGDIRALGIARGKRAARLPNAPTLKEAGVAGVEADAWFALFAPAKTPAPVVERLYQAVAQAFAKDKPKELLAAQGMTLALRTPADVAAALPAEVTKWAEVIRIANVSVE
jgi:tripartite-type tricarboxylate transporter receptor subunit TctC